MATATATANYPDNMQMDLRDVLCFELGYQETIDGQPNPQNKSQFLQEEFNLTFRQWIKNTYQQGKRRQQTITGIDFS